MRSSNRVGSFVVEASDINDLIVRVSRCLNRIGIIDVKGNNMFYLPNC